MAYRVIMIENESQLKVKLNNLIVHKPSQDDIWIPLDDISMIVIDNLATSISMRLMNQFAEHGIGLIVCDMKHNPSGYYNTIANHSRASKMIGYQIECGYNGEYYRSLWSDIVSNKIENQWKVLRMLGFSEEIISTMQIYQSEVYIGDDSNREAHAAKIYFNTLMGSSFSRGNEDILMNSGLDYGYAIIRSYIAKTCVAYGLNTQIGVHHKNEYNRFNLCDDLIEPLRPIVDIFVYNLLADEEIFTSDHRHALVNMLNHKIFYKNRKMHISSMIEEYIMNFQGLISGAKETLVFPNVENYIGGEDEV